MSRRAKISIELDASELAIVHRALVRDYNRKRSTKRAHAAAENAMERVSIEQVNEKIVAAFRNLEAMQKCS